MQSPKRSKVRVAISFLWRSLRGDLRSWLPTRGNVLFTLLVVGSLFWVQNAGALPSWAPAAPSTSSSTISYQGYVADSSGNPVNNSLNMAFRLYNVASGGTPLWSETHGAMNVSDGLFSVLLGSNTPISQDVFANNSDLWLGITIGSDNEMSPREKIASAPYAMVSNVPDGSITQAKLANNAVTSAKIADGVVASGDVANDSLTASDLAPNSVGNSEMADNAISSNEVINNSLTANDLAANSVGNSEMADNAIGSNEVINNSLTASDLANNSVGAGELASNSIYSGDIRDGEVKSADIADGTVTQSKLNDIRMYVTEGTISVDGNGHGCLIFSLPSGRFTKTPHVFVVRRSIGSWEDNAEHARGRFIETTQRSTSSVRICVDDDFVSSGHVGVAILAIQTD